MYNNVLDLKLSTNLCNVNEISYPLTKLKSRKSPGSDQLSMLVLKKCAVKLAPSLSWLKNSFDTGQVPFLCPPSFFSFFLFFFFNIYMYIYIWEEKISSDKIFVIRNLRALSYVFSYFSEFIFSSMLLSQLILFSSFAQGYWVLSTELTT